jgi:hypothetical protein
VQALAADWKEHGAATIEAVRQKTPDKYCELIAKVVPKEMLISADRRATDFSDCQDMHEIGRRLLLQTGILEAAITDTMIDQTVAANGNFVDRLLLIATGNWMAMPPQLQRGLLAKRYSHCRDPRLLRRN